MTDPFDSPGSASQVEWENYLGKLLLITPVSKEIGVKTKDYGEKDAIRADMVVLDAPDGPEELPDILVFPLVLQGQLRRNIGKDRPVIGRLGKDKDEVDSKGRVTRQGAWKLLEAADADKEKTRKYLSGNAEKYDDVPF